MLEPTHKDEHDWQTNSNQNVGQVVARPHSTVCLEYSKAYDDYQQ